MKTKPLAMVVCFLCVCICSAGVANGSEFSMIGVICWSFLLGCAFQSWVKE